MGYRGAMPTLDETSPVLIGTLRMLMDNYGVRGVYDTCAQLVNELTPPDAGNGHNVFGVTEELGIEVVDFGITKGLPAGAAEQLQAMLPETTLGDVLDPNCRYTDDELRNSPYAGTFADVVAAAQDPVPVPMKAMVQHSGIGLVVDPDSSFTPTGWPPVTVHNDPPELSDSDSFDAWRQQRGEATGDPQNVGPMGNR